MDDQVPEAVKTERLLELQALIAGQTQAFNRALVGRTLPVLFERGGRHAGQLVGRTPYLQGVHAAADRALVGRVADVIIADVHANSLPGRLKQPLSDRVPCSPSDRTADAIAMECTSA